MQPLQRSSSQDGCLPTPPHLLGVQPEVLLACVPGTLGKSFLVATPRVAQLGGGKSAFNIFFGGSRSNWGSAFSDLGKGSVDTRIEGRFCNLCLVSKGKEGLLGALWPGAQKPALLNLQHLGHAV